VLPENWKKEIEEAVDKATGRADQASQRANEIQSKISAGIDAVAGALNKQNEKHSREDSSKRSRETWTLCAVGAAAVFTLGLDVLSGCQLREMQKVYGPIKEQAEAAKNSAIAAQDAANTASRNVDVLINSERARLFVNTAVLNKAVDNDPHPQVVYSFVNMGRGTGVITEMLVNCRLIGSQVPQIPYEEAGKKRYGEFAVGPAATFGVGTGVHQLPPCVPDQELRPEDWVAIGSGDEFVLLIGYVRYRDAFHRYKWNFASVYGDAKFFTTRGLPATYNDETQEAQPQ
jgi:hypothetical protein